MYRNRYTQGPPETRTEAGGQAPEGGTDEALADARPTPATSPAGGPETPNPLGETALGSGDPSRVLQTPPQKTPGEPLQEVPRHTKVLAWGSQPQLPTRLERLSWGPSQSPGGASRVTPKPALRPSCAALVLTWVPPTSPAVCSPCSNSRLRGGTPSPCSRARLGTAGTPPHTQAALSSCSTEDLGYLPWLHLGRGQLVHACPSEKATVAKSPANKDGL